MRWEWVNQNGRNTLDGKLTDLIPTKSSKCYKFLKIPKEGIHTEWPEYRYGNKNLRTPKLADDPWSPMKERWVAGR